jgi:hypothetical protein
MSEENEIKAKESGGEEKKEFNAEEAFKGLAEKLDKALAPKGKEKETSFDPEALLKELEADEEPRPRAKKSQEDSSEPDFEKMSPKEFVEYTLSTVRDTLVSPLEKKLAVLGVRAEVAECKAKYDDFSDYKDEVFKIAMMHPELSLEQAYLQASGKKAVESKREEAARKAKEEKEKEEKARKSSGPRPIGEKSSISRDASTPAPKTLQDAAVMALKDVLGKET